MHDDRVATPKTPPQVTTGLRLVRACVTIASRKVTIPMSLDLPRLRMPVGAFPNPTKERSLTVEVGDLLGTAVAVGSAGVTASPSVLLLVVVVMVVVVAAARLRGWLWPRFGSSLRDHTLIRMKSRIFKGDVPILRDDGVNGGVGLRSGKSDLLFSQGTSQRGMFTKPWVLDSLYLKSVPKKYQPPEREHTQAVGL